MNKQWLSRGIELLFQSNLFSVMFLLLFLSESRFRLSIIFFVCFTLSFVGSAIVYIQLTRYLKDREI